MIASYRPEADSGQRQLSSRLAVVAIDENWFENERMHRAAAEGDVREMSRLYAAGRQLDRFDDRGRAPLHYAVEGEHYKAAEWLIQQGVSQ